MPAQFPIPANCTWQQLSGSDHWQLEKPYEEPRLDGFGRPMAQPLGELCPAGDGLTIVRVILPDGQPFDVRRRGDINQAANDLVDFLIETKRVQPATPAAV